jgi:hypothetical protein
VRRNRNVKRVSRAFDNEGHIKSLETTSIFKIALIKKLRVNQIRGEQATFFSCRLKSINLTINQQNNHFVSGLYGCKTRLLQEGIWSECARGQGAEGNI